MLLPRLTRFVGALRSGAEALRPLLLSGLELALPRWPLWVCALAFGGACGAIAFEVFRRLPASYPDFIVGFLTVQGLSKHGDYAMLLAVIAGSAAFFVVLSLLFRRLNDLGGAAALAEADMRLLIAVIPGFTWLASFLLPQTLNTGMFWLTVYLASMTGLALLLLVARPSLWFAPGRVQMTAVLDGAVLLPAAAMLAVLAVAMFGNRVGILFGPPWVKIPGSLQGAIGLAAIFAGLTVTALALRASAQTTQAALRRLTIAIQAFLPGLFLAVLPVPAGPVDRRLFYDPAIRTEVWVLMALLALILWADLVRLWRKGEREDLAPSSSVSIFSLIAVLVYCRTPILAPLPTPFDDYHAGEDFIPWWSWVTHGMVPLWDFTPPRGLINYKTGALAALFTEPTAAGMLATTPYLYALVMLVVFPAVALVVGPWIAFLVLAFATLDDRLGDIDALMTAAFCVVIFTWNRMTHCRWLVTWFVVGTAAVLVAPGQGGLLVLATAPGGLWRLYRAWHDERPLLLRTAAITGAIVLALALLTPLGLMVAGAIRYGVGQSAVNGIANGLPWGAAFASIPNLHPWLVEILRFSWIAAGAAAIVLTLWTWARPNRDARVLFVCGAVALLCVLYIVRSAVRVDTGGVGRPAWTSVWVLTLLLPILFSTLFEGRRRLVFTAFTVIVASALTLQFGIVGIDPAFQRPLALQTPAPNLNRVDGAALGMPNMGVINMEQQRAEKLAATKRALDEFLAPGETYVDMTNGGAHYFYFDRPPPSDLSAFYNMITSSQQRRAVEGIIAKNVPVALIGPDNALIDDLRAGLRAPLLYRHLVLNFVPMTINGLDFMIHPDRMKSAGLGAVDPATPSEQALTTLDRVFFTQYLHWTPFTFGQSARSLRGSMRDVLPLDPTRAAAVMDAERQADGTYKITGALPALQFDLTAQRLRGRDAGLLRFDFRCLVRSVRPTVVVRWTGPDGLFNNSKTVYFPSQGTTMIVPLDAAPRWLLSPNVGTLRLEFRPEGCTAFSLDNIALAQRTEVEQMEEAQQSKASGP